MGSHGKASEILGLNPLTGLTFNALTILIAAIAIVLGALSAYYARRALFPPRRRLAIRFVDPAPLISARPNSKDLAITFRGAAIKDPWVTRVQITNTGRHAISTDHFDAGRPIEIAMGAEILDVLQVVTDGNRATPRHAIAEKALQIGPDLIASRQTVELQVLTNGQPGTGVITSYLIDTVVDRERVRPAVLGVLLGERSAALWTALGGISAVLAVVVSIIATLQRK
jgi:hypothetical protein